MSADRAGLGAEVTGPAPRATAYDAFISYNRRADYALAQGIHRGIERIATPWYRIRASRAFRDDTVLAADRDMWGEIQAALRASAHFVLLASPAAAASIWVDQEIRYWRAQHGPGALPIVVLTEGEIEWDRAIGDFDIDRSNALPPCLRGAFAVQPRFVDARVFEAVTKPPSLQDPTFRNLVAEIAATVRGTTKAALVGEDVRHRRNLRLIAGTVTVALAGLAVTSVVFGIRENRQADLAVARALAAEARARIATDPEAALDRAVRSLAVATTREGQEALDEALVETRGLARSPVHRSAVVALAVSRDGELVASATAEGQIHVWEAGTGRERARLRHPGPLAGIAFSPEGDRLFSAGGAARQAGSIIAWRLASGVPETLLAAPAPLTTFAARHRFVAAASDLGEVILSRETADGVTTRRRALGAGVRELSLHDPSVLVTSGVDGTVNCLEVPTLRSLCRLRAPADVIVSRWLAGSGRVAMAARGGVVWLREAESGRLVRRWRADGATLHALAVAPGGARLATAGANGAEIRDERGSVRHRLDGHRGDVFSVEFSADGRRVVTGGSDGEAIIWDSATGVALAVLRGHESSVRLARFGPGADRAYTASFDRTARSWNAGTGLAIASRREHRSAITAVLSAPGTVSPVLSTSVDGTARAWDAAGGPATLRARHPGAIFAAALSPSGALAASGDETGAVEIWPLADGRPTTTRSHASSVFGLAFINDRRLLVGETSGALSLWTSGEPVPVRRARAHRGAVLGIAVAQTTAGTRIATSGEDGVVRLWDGRLNAVAPVLRGHANAVFAIGFDAAGNRLATASFDRTARIWSLAGGRPIVLRGHASEVLDVQFAGPGRVVTAGQDRTLRLWSARDGRLLQTGTGHLGPVFELAVSQDGRRIVSASGDGEARVWDAADLRLIATLRGAGGQLNGVAIDARGSRIVTGGNDGVLRTYRCAPCDGPDRRLAAARRALARVAGSPRPADRVREPRSVFGLPGRG